MTVPVRGNQRRRRHRLAVAATIGLIAVLAACVNQVGSPEPAMEHSPGQLVGTVTRVVDGDTFWISTAGTSIRVWGLDAPETNQPGGARATAALTQLIAGQTLSCRQRDIDRYGRIVGQCFLPDGRDITAAMIASGTATEYCRFSGNYYRTC
jgi:endonuclease YncB( thermonuclease family)